MNLKILFPTMIIILLFSVSTGLAHEITLNETLDFNSGTYTNTNLIGGEVVLTASSVTGSWESAILNDETEEIWEEVHWEESEPIQFFPTNSGSDALINMSGTVLYYVFNETSGNMVDLSGQSNVGTVNNFVSTTYHNTTQQFSDLSITTFHNYSGINEHVLVTDDPSLDLTTTGTFFITFSPTGTPADRTLIQKRGATDNDRYEVEYMQSTNSIDVTFDGSTYSSVGADITDDEPNTVIFTWNATGYTYYINGVLDSTGAIVATPGAIADDLYIGTTESVAQDYDGLFHTMVLMNRYITQNEALNMTKRDRVALRGNFKVCDDAGCVGDSFIDIGISEPADVSGTSEWAQVKFDFWGIGNVFTPELNFIEIHFQDVPVPGTIDYPHAGSGEYDYNHGEGLFNQQLTGESVAQDFLTDTSLIPLVGDIDSDGVNEIVVKDDNNINIYSSTSLTIEASVSTGTTDRTSNMVITELTGDTVSEIVLFNEITQTIYIISWDGAVSTTQTLSGGLTGHSDGESQIACFDQDDLDEGRCLLVYSDDRDYNPNAVKYIRAVGFNYTNIGSPTNIRQNINNEATYCMPKLKQPVIKDIDADGTEEITFSYISWSRFVGDDMFISTVELNSTLGVTLEQTNQETGTADFLGSTLADCVAQDAGQYFSSPAVFQWDGVGAFEIGYGYMNSDDTYKGRITDNIGTNIRSFPDVFNGDGTLMGNPVIGDFFEDAGSNDICIPVYNRELDGDIFFEWTCTTKNHDFGLLGDYREYSYLVTDDYNISNTYGTWNHITHGTDQSQVTFNTDPDSTYNPDEIVSSYGVFYLDVLNCIEFLNIETCDVVRIWQNPQGDSVLIPADIEQNGNYDMVGLKDDRVFIIDDGFTNSPAEITAYSIDPCIDAVIKVNETITVDVKVEDPDSDAVTAKVILYEGLGALEQDSGFKPVDVTGTVFTFFVQANSTGSNIPLTMIAKDTQNGEEVEITKTIDVASNGVTAGECSTSFETELSTTTTTGDEFTATELDLNDNGITNGVSELATTTKTSELIIWLVIMAAVAWGVISMAPNMFGIITLGIIQLVLLILGVQLGFIGFGVLLTIIIISLAVLTPFLRRMITGDGTNNG